MKLFTLPLILAALCSTSALADPSGNGMGDGQFPRIPAPAPGSGFGRGEGHGPHGGRFDRPMISPLCSGAVSGTWLFKGGRPMNINLVSDFSGRTYVTIAAKNVNVTKEGSCRATRSGATIVSNDPAFPFTLNIDHDGSVVGVVTVAGFNGRTAGSVPPAPPAPLPPMPNPPMPFPPAPPMRPSDLCSGVISGVWAFKGGREMTITLVRQGRGQIMASVSQRNGSFSVAGTCFPNGSGVSISFGDIAAPNGSGQLFIDFDGQAVGSVSGAGFQGQLR